MPPITHAQLRGARGMLDWSMVDLAKAAGVSVSSVLNAEGRDPERVPPSATAAMRTTLEAAGVAFTSEGGGPGVRLGSRGRSVFSRFL